MAMVGLESFSIREYTAKMRGVDAGKCWPFGGSGDREEREVENSCSSLPPMTCRRYRWWSTELLTARSACGTAEGGDADNSSGGDSEERERVASDSVVEIQHDMSEEEKGRRKARMRAPKKRSIVELFAVAPPIEAIENDCDGSGGEEGGMKDVGEEREQVDEGVVGSGSEAEDGSGEDAEFDGSGNGARTEEPWKRKVEEEEPVKVRIMKKRKGKRKEKVRKKEKQQKKLKLKRAKMGIRFNKKEKTHNISIPPKVDFSQLLHNSVLKRCGKDIKGACHKKAANTKGLPEQSKLKVIESTLIFDKHEGKSSTVPIHGILKNHSRVTSVNKSRKASCSQNAHSPNLSPAKRSERHVSFSDKEDILSHKDKPDLPSRLPQIKSVCEVFSDGVDASEAVDRSTKDGNLICSTDNIDMINECDNHIASNTEDGITQSSSKSTKLADVQDLSTTTAFFGTDPQVSQDIDATMDRPVDLNRPFQGCSSSHLLDSYSPVRTANHLCSGPSGNLNISRTVRREGSDPEYLFGGRIQIRPDKSGILSSHVSDCSAVMSSLCSTMGSGSQSSEPCLSRSRIDNGQSYKPVCHDRDVFRIVSESEPICRQSQKDLTLNICPSVVPKNQLHQNNIHFEGSLTRSDLAVSYRDKYISGDYIGLPLNSHGELIQRHSRGNVGLTQMPQNQNRLNNSGNDFLMHAPVESRNNVDLMREKEKFPATAISSKEMINQIPLKKNIEACLYGKHTTSRLAFPQFSHIDFAEECQGSSMERSHYVHYLNSDQRPTRVYCGRRMEHMGAENHDSVRLIQAGGASQIGFRPVIQPTMRLMGKDVTVGTSNTDFQCLERGNPVVRMADQFIPNLPPQQRWVNNQSSESSRTHQSHPMGTQHKHSSFYQMMSVDPRYQHGHIDRVPGPYWTPGTLMSSINEYYASRLDSFPAHPTDKHTCKNSLLVENRPSAVESANIVTQLPLGSSNSCDACTHMSQNYSRCQHNQVLSNISSSPAQSTFLNHDSEKYDQSILSSQTPKNMPHWLINATQQEKFQNSSTSYSGLFSKYHPRAMSEMNLFAVPSHCSAPVISFSPYNTTSSPMQSLSVHSAMSPFPMIQLNSAANSSHQEMRRNKDGTNPGCSYIKGLDHANKRKWSSLKADEFARPAKKPNSVILGNVEIQEGTMGSAYLPGSAPYSSHTAEHDNHGQVVDMSYALKDFNMNPICYDLPKLDSGSRCGPIKLSAGAKHILKPNQNMDLDNSMPVHSTIPFAMGPGSGKVHDIQNKSAKIFQF